MLDKRKKRILEEIIEEYIHTAEPVSSSSIAKHRGLNFSSATIRNDMAELEEEQYLDKPHTSSGRIPSRKGYRFYVDELLKEDHISRNEMEYIRNKLEAKVNEIEDFTKIATSTLSELTHYTSIAVNSKAETHTILDMKFVLLGSRVLMAVILTDAGAIKESIIKFHADITEEQVATINTLFNNKLRGKKLSKIDKPLEEYITSEMSYELKIIKPIIEEINHQITNKNEIYLEGTNRVFDFPEFKNAEIAKGFLNVLDEKEFMLDLFQSDKSLAKDINIYIGEELRRRKLKRF